MGFDVTIERADGRPLGNIADVNRTLAEVFPGIDLGRSLSGPEKLQKAADQGVQFPEILRKHFEVSPSEYEGDYQCPEFSAEFHLGAFELVQQIYVVAYGDMGAAQTVFAKLERHDWIATHP